MTNIDDLIKDDEESESKGNQFKSGRSEEIEDIMVTSESEETQSGTNQTKERVLIGSVEHFFDKINVAAINLTGTLKLGDTIEIVGGGNTTTVKVSSMQINRKEISEASDGDEIGIKVDGPVKV